MTFSHLRWPLLFLSPHPRPSGERHAFQRPQAPGWLALVFLALLGLQSTACAPEEREPERELTASQQRECENGSTQTLACGLNGRGTQSRTCKANRWGEPTPCIDPDVCVDGSSESLSCGLNGRGTQSRTCVAGAWSSFGACIDPDVCVDGSSESLACGLNGRGTQSRTCTAGSWDAPTACTDPDVCIDGAEQQASCGILGTHSRQCTTGQWSDYGTCSAPSSISLQVPGRKDMVHDARRNLLYITTSGTAGEVRVYNLLTRQFEPSLLTGGSFSGIDLSPDGDQLLVADLLTDANNQNWVHHIDLTTGTPQRIFFTRAFGEGGTFTAVFTSDTEAIVTSQYNGSGWVPMRKVDLTTGTAQSIASVRQATMLALSADGSTVAYAESNISSGEWGRYTTGAQTFAESRTNWFVYEIAVSRQATQYAIPTYGGLFIFNDALSRQATLGTYASQLPIGAVYSPVADELYLAWYGANTSIDVYSATTLQKLRDIAPTPGLFSWTGNHAFDNGRMRISRDGSLLFATTSNSGLVIHLTGR